MKENSNIDQLFRKAASTPVHTSFDEAKEKFSASLAHRDAGKWRILRTKTWIIMITFIFSAAVAGILLFGSNTDLSNTTRDINSITEPSQKQNAETTKGQPVLHADNDLSVEQLEIMSPALLDSFTPMSPLKQSVFLMEPNLTQLVQFKKNNADYNPYIFNFASDRRNEKDTVEIPTLTEKEMAENEKYKKKMMKALVKSNKEHYVYIPSGTTTYKGEEYSVQAFYMQVNEVTNLQYRTFLNDLLIQGREEDYKTAYPQEYQWTEQLEGDHSAMVNLYFTHPAYDEYPVVNVTREGAEMYCVWLTLETTNSKFMDDNMFLNDVRLPQRLEWTYAASNGKAYNVYPWGGPSTQNAKACYLANYKPEKGKYYDDGAFFTAKTGTYTQNDFGLYNMSGNVAEMVYGTTEFTSKEDLVALKDDPGTAGGGWMDDAEALKIEGDDPYDGITEGHPNIGFRVVLTFLK